MNIRRVYMYQLRKEFISNAYSLCVDLATENGCILFGEGDEGKDVRTMIDYFELW